MFRCLYLSSICGLLLSCQGGDHHGNLLRSDLVDLHGKETITVIRNASTDTLNLKTLVYNLIPYTETFNEFLIAPGGKDSVSFSASYPVFLECTVADAQLRLFVVPGARLDCNFLDRTPGHILIDFEGDYADINKYYLAHSNHFGSFYETNRPYVLAGDTIKNFDNYPKFADSLAALSQTFLDQYDSPLPLWFIRHERLRVEYLAGWLKHNIPFTKEYYDGRKIQRSMSYFDFYRRLSLTNQDVILNADYLIYANTFLYQYSYNKDPVDSLDYKYYLIDSLYGSSRVGDVLRLNELSQSLIGSRRMYREQIAKVRFGKAVYRRMLDSLVVARLGLPIIGDRSPDPLFLNELGEQVRLSSHSGDVIMLNFWATWCAPCLKEFPAENKLFEKYYDKGLTVINVCVESNFARWKSITEQFDLRMINLYTPSDEQALVKKQFEISALPRTIIIGPDFKVLENYGKRASEFSETDVDSLLALP